MISWEMMLMSDQVVSESSLDHHVLIVREFEAESDKLLVEEMENKCEVGPAAPPSSGGHGTQISLFTDNLGDPCCRIRHSPTSLMLVAEIQMADGTKEIVGLVRGCVKTVTCGQTLSRNGKNSQPANFKTVPVYTKLAYILGLRVSSSHRRMGIGLKLVTRMEEWFRKNGAEYSYMATESDNEASIKLFTERCGYSKFRTPSILVQPVYAHRVRISKRVEMFRLSTSDAEKLYRERFSTIEFFPRDIDSVLKNKLSLGTFVAVPRGSFPTGSWPGTDEFLSNPPESWAILSVWNCKEVFMLELRGASRTRRALAKASRVIDGALPWLRLPSIPQLFRPFGSHFLYGLGGSGTHSVKLMKALCGFAHNLAKESGCEVVATEVSSCEPLRLGVPHWKRISLSEDLWCIKRLGEDYGDGSVGDWTKSAPGLSIFVDPREL